MFAAIFPVLFNVFLSFCVETISINNESRCSLSSLDCICQDIENITKKSIESCCKSEWRTLIVTGSNVRNISINILGSSCLKSMENLKILDTGISSFHFQFFGLENVVNVNIERNYNLTDFNKLQFFEINENIKSITVENNIIRRILNRTFSNLSNLTDLKLSDNKIGYIEDHSFANLTNLSTLYLNNNILTALNAEMFFGLKKLKILSLLNNFLVELKSDSFKFLTNLQFLQLSRSSHEFQSVSYIPDRVFFSLKQLKFLNMTLKIRNVTSLTFYGLKDLESLSLQGNSLTTISLGTFQQIAKVVTINLSRNQIRCLLPETFYSLPSLKSLDLSFNELSYISNEVFAGLSTLQTLDLSENNIYVIEKNAFASLKSLVIFKMTTVHGKAKNELQNNFQESPLAKLRKSTKISGLRKYFGISSGADESAEILNPVKLSPQELELRKTHCPSVDPNDREMLDSPQNGSRKYLLIIVGICVIFLLIAFAIIMSYRAWSKMKMSDLSFNVEAHEKQEMLINKPVAANGRVEDVPNDKDKDKTDSYAINETQTSNLQASTFPLSEEHNHSDDESALTPLGVL